MKKVFRKIILYRSVKSVPAIIHIRSTIPEKIVPCWRRTKQRVSTMLASLSWSHARSSILLHGGMLFG
uniref:Uncharacterized protein n=1 Tax=Oryza barthii TaxID=65489 RepID=A0A0D3H5L4_9ORYZ